MKKSTLGNLPNNLRFYVLACGLLFGLLIAAWLRVEIPSDRLFYIRLQQVFGFVALAYWYLAMIASPLAGIFGKQGLMSLFLFARRAIGVLAAFFALMHAAIAFWGQIGGLDGLGFLPERFRWSLGFGLLALIVLLIMAATSFDKVVRYMTLPRWLLLHRAVYGACVLVFLHVWLVATHLASAGFKTAIASMLAILAGMEAVRIANNLAKKSHRLASKKIIIMLLIWLGCLALIFGIPKMIGNYHEERHGGDHGPKGAHE